MTRKATPKTSRKPTPAKPRKGKRREDEENVRVAPINPPAVGGGVARGEGPKKK